MSLIATLAIAATLSTTPVPPSGAPNTIPTPPAIVIVPSKVLGCTQSRFHSRVNRVYAKKRVSKKDRRWIFEARKCLKHQYKAKLYQRRKAQQREQRIQIEALTPYRGPDGSRWAIPWYVVNCESKGDWSADNPSSDARGPYQLLGHGEPWPANTPEARLRHHQIAAALWAGGRGSSNWVCA